MTSAQDALAAILSRAEPLSIEDCPLKDSLHRHLASPVVAPIPLPPFDNSAMDGYVIAGEGDSFQVMPTIAAGDRGPSVIHPEEAFRIMTGAPVPEGAYAVVPFEEWPIMKPVTRGDNIRRAGEDVAKGDRLFGAGERITSRTIALMAALGLETVRVFRRPSVRVLSTGSELVDVGARRAVPLRPGQIYNSNGPALAAALKEMGIEAETVGAAVDDEDTLKKALNRGNGADVLITIGGVSAGDFDLVPKALEALGAQVVFHKVSIKPGKPLLYALWGRTHVFALPGNPVSALLVFDRFVRPALLKMMGAEKISRTPHEAVAAEPLKGASGKEVYLRGIVTSENGRFIARSAGAQGSAMLRSLARANAVLIVPASKQRIAAGESLSFEFLEDN
ncbi:MAG TPA: gephyrin-like molybdotransferase Glp [bacterium]|nr:gephyrin-like molybdotransferase Glp [bacterium]